MVWDNAFEFEPRKRAPYLRACDFVWLGYPRYLMDWGGVDDLKERELIWKRAKRCVLGGGAYNN